MMKSLFAVAAFAGAAFAQATVAEYTVVASTGVAAPGETVTVEVFGQATVGQIGNNSGINGVNLSVEIAGGTVVDGSIAGNGEVFGATNTLPDAEGFDISFSSNSFTGNNFSAGLVLFSFDVLAGSENIVITTSEGTISLFAAATGLPGAFQPSIAYDSIDFGSATVLIPAPAASAVLGFAGLAIARRRRA
ncbi:MAG: hypothetical protein AAGI53_16090 [Planctomycetota bacterium]